MRSKEREVYFVVVRFVLQMLHFAVGVLDERSLFGQTLYMLQYQSGLLWKQWGKTMGNFRDTHRISQLGIQCDNVTM